MANDNLLTPAQELDAISKALATRVKSVMNVKGRTQTFINTERERRIAATYAWLRKVVEARDVKSDAEHPVKKVSLSVQYMGSIGCLSIHPDATDEEIREIAAKAVQAGTIRGLITDPIANFTDFVVDRQTTPNEVCDFISLRPKTPF